MPHYISVRVPNGMVYSVHGPRSYEQAAQFARRVPRGWTTVYRVPPDTMRLMQWHYESGEPCIVVPYILHPAGWYRVRRTHRDHSLGLGGTHREGRVYFTRFQGDVAVEWERTRCRSLWLVYEDRVDVYDASGVGSPSVVLPRVGASPRPSPVLPRTRFERINEEG